MYGCYLRTCDKLTFGSNQTIHIRRGNLRPETPLLCSLHLNSKNYLLTSMTNYFDGKTTRRISGKMVRSFFRHLHQRAHPRFHPVSILSVRDDFGAKRQQARQALASLPVSIFHKLLTDIHFELSCRFPKIAEIVKIVFYLSADENSL